MSAGVWGCNRRSETDGRLNQSEEEMSSVQKPTFNFVLLHVNQQVLIFKFFIETDEKPEEYICTVVFVCAVLYYNMFIIIINILLNVYHHFNIVIQSLRM